MIHVIANIEAHPGQRDALIAEFHGILAEVRAEAGCLAYGPAVDHATDIGGQAPVRPNTVVIVEQWESVPHLKAHLDAPHMHAFRARAKDLIAGISLQILGPA